MHRASRVIQLAWIAVLLSTCATQTTAVRDAPSEVLSSFISALNHADIDAAIELFAPDATAFLPLDSSPSELVGRDAIRSVLSPFFSEIREQGSGPEYMHLVAKQVHIRSSGRTAIITFDAGNGPVTSRRTLVIEKTSAGWRITHFHGSNIRRSTPGAGA